MTGQAFLLVMVVLATVAVVFVGLNLSLGSRQLDRPLDLQYGVGDPQFLRAAGAILTPSLVSGNRVQELLNGDEIFPAMIRAIRGAQSTVTFETYIYWSGQIGAEFSREFAAAARRGVEVKLLLDWVGGDLSHARLDEMRRAGVDLRRYNPLRLRILGI